MRHYLLFGLLASLSLILAMGGGASGLTWSDLFALARDQVNPDAQDLMSTILLQIRLPRVLLAGITGSALAVAGVATQGLFRNPLASPSVLGTESASAASAVFILYGAGPILHFWSLPAASILGAWGGTWLILLLARGHIDRGIDRLLLTGLTLSTLFGALVSLMISVSLEDYQKSGAMMKWLLGSFSGKGWEHVAIASLPTAVGLALMVRLAPLLDILALGIEPAQSLSLDIPRCRRWAVLTVASLVGGAVASAGALPFVGLIVPHAIRRWVGPHHLKLTILSALGGLSLTVMADLLARTVTAPQEIEVGVVTALLGAPFFLWQLTRSTDDQSSVRS